MLPTLPVPRDRSLLHALTPYALAASGLCSPRAPPTRAFPDHVRHAPVRCTYVRATCRPWTPLLGSLPPIVSTAAAADAQGRRHQRALARAPVRGLAIAYSCPQRCYPLMHPLLHPTTMMLLC